MTILLRALTLATLAVTSLMPLPAGLWWRAASPMVPAATTASASHTPASPLPQELDAFMERVLRRREINWLDLRDYVFSERESVQVHGSAGTPLAGYLHEYHWFVREGSVVRSPVRLDGVEVSPEFRATYEAQWLEREHLASGTATDNADARAGFDRVSESIAPDTVAAQASTLDGDAVAGPQRNPGAGPTVELGESFEREYFLGLNFEPGNYLFAGKETLEGREVLRIEYYPSNMFASENRAQFWERRNPMGAEHEGYRKPAQRERVAHAPVREAPAGPDRVFGWDEESARKLNVTTLVTLWVDQDEEQIVKISMENVSTEFLNISWLLRIEDVRASMTMGKPFDGVWLPREIEIVGRGATAEDSYELVYRRVFFDYKRTDVEARVRYRMPRSPR